MKILESMLYPESFKTFSEQSLFKSPCSAPYKAESLSKVLNWKLIEEILSSGHDDCWLPKNGKMLNDPSLNTGRLNLETVLRKYHQGHTLLIRHGEVAHPVLEMIADDFFHLFKRPIDIQIYCTPKGEQGFGWHYDLEEVFVVQCFGEKEFYLYENTENPPSLDLNKGIVTDLSRYFKGPELRCHLKAGDWLYIPSGYWHCARAITDSFHFSVGVLAIDERRQVAMKELSNENQITS